MRENQEIFVKDSEHKDRTLEIDKPSYLEGSLHWTQGFHTEQIPGQCVEIEVRTSRLDVGFAKDSNKGSATTGSAKNLQSLELAEIVRRVGSRVKHMSMSDRTIAI